jgi:hypothetical protein
VNLVRQTTGVHGIRGLRLQTRVLAITPCPPVIDLNGTVFHLKFWSPHVSSCGLGLLPMYELCTLACRCPYFHRALYDMLSCILCDAFGLSPHFNLLVCWFIQSDESDYY